MIVSLAALLSGCLHPELKQSSEAREVRATVRDWLAKHPDFVKETGQFIPSVVQFDHNHAEAVVNSFPPGPRQGVLRLERVSTGWKVLSAKMQPHAPATRPNQALQRTAGRSDI